MKLKTYIANVLLHQRNSSSYLLLDQDQRSRLERLVRWYNTIHEDDEQLITCNNNHCNTLLYDVDGTSARDQHNDELIICDDCCEETFRCADCNETCMDERSGGENSCGSTICTECAEEYFTCDGCDRVCSNDDYYEDGRCDSCGSCDDGDEYGVPEYHSKVRNYHIQREARLFGIEIEIKVKDYNDVQQVYQKIVNHGFIGERDGSLDGTLGIEIVAHPMSFEDNQKKWLPLLNSLRGDCVGWNAGTGYGMHISMNRTAYTTLHQGKIVTFIHNNKSLCEKVAGRKENQWAAYHEKKVTCAKREYDEKYQAISLRDHRRMEVRIFRSNLSPEGFNRNLEFVAAIAEFTKSVSFDGELTEERFLVWLTQPSNRKAYPTLHEFLVPFFKQFHQARKVAYQATLTK